MQQALEAPFMALAKKLDFAPLRTPIVSCLDGRVYDGDSDPGDWLRRMWATFRQPVEFGATVRGLLAKGDFHFLDVGPSGTLATFVKYLLPADSASKFSDVINPFGMDERKYLGALQRMGLNDAAGTAHGPGNASYSAMRATS